MESLWSDLRHLTSSEWVEHVCLIRVLTVPLVGFSFLSSIIAGAIFSLVFFFFVFLFTSVVMSYNPAADSTIATPGKKRKRTEENGEVATPSDNIPVTPSTPATEEGLYPLSWVENNLVLLGNWRVHSALILMVKDLCCKVKSKGYDQVRKINI